MTKVSVRYDDEGRIRNMVMGYRAGAWTILEDTDFPSGGSSVWYGEHPGEGLAFRLFYRPETPNDTPPERYNDEPGPNDWHPQSTETIGVVFERTETDALE